MTANLTTIMTKAHAATRACVGSPFYAGKTYAQIFAAHLRRIWREAKMLAVKPVSAAEALRREILSLESKDRLTFADADHLAGLRARAA